MSKTTMDHIELHITGMHCSGCAMNVERALTALEGVGKAAVSITDRTASVDFDGQKPPGTISQGRSPALVSSCSRLKTKPLLLHREK